MITWIFNLFENFRRYQTQWIEDLPNDPKRNNIYIIGGRKHPFYAAIVCPRKKCKEIIHLDVASDAKKKWKIIEHSNKTISISPSIYVTNLPCNCHYWIKKGKVIWCETPSLFVPQKNQM